MAIAKITLVCSKCGCSFEHRKECHNRREADSYEAWASANISDCPTCARERRKDESYIKLMDKLAELGRTLPELEGVSEKQIVYAESVREKCLVRSLSDLPRYCSGIAMVLDPERNAEVLESYKERGLSFEAGLAEDLEYVGLADVHLCMTSTSAREILDTLAR